MHQRFILDMLAPVPVGHRVELRFFERLGEGQRQSFQRKPQITDLDTGVRYVPAELHSTSTASSWFDASCWRDEPDAGFVRQAQSVRGTVVACTVATPAAYPGFATVLVIEPAEAARTRPSTG